MVSWRERASTAALVVRDDRRRFATAPTVGGPDDGDQEGFGGGAFGVRRPLRFLAYKLELDERQVSELARILDELKTERAQAATRKPGQ